MSNLIIYQDDICVGARTQGELDTKVTSLLTKLEEAGMQINRKKCVFFRFLGYQISADGVRPDEKLVNKVLETRTPTCRNELESFLGLTNYRTFPYISPPKYKPYIWQVGLYLETKLS